MLICAWCHAIVSRLRNAGRSAASAPRVSHGICPTCLQAQLQR
jgi:hypothetical protein